MSLSIVSFFFFFNDTATTETYTLSLHDALPIYLRSSCCRSTASHRPVRQRRRSQVDRKSTRLNSSHANMSYAVLCLKKKKNFGRRALRPLQDVHEPQLASRHKAR